MAKSKWIENAAADDRVEQIAAPALEARLKRVWEFLELAADRSQNTPQDVHQLRVATRRATATMENFAALLPPRRAVWLSRQLKRIRRAANDVRDFDVLTERVAALGCENPGGGFTALLKQIEKRRHDAQKPIQDIHAKLGRKNFMRRVERLRKRVRLRAKYDKLTHPTYATVARQALYRLVDALFTASLLDSNNNAALHALRIQGKRLRYAIEIFAGALDRNLRMELYPVMEQLQDKLGDVNDHVTAEAHLGHWLAESHDAEVSAALRMMIERERVALQEARQQFLAWWTPERRDDLQHRFQAALAIQSTESVEANGVQQARSADSTGRR